jgi:BON domain
MGNYYETFDPPFFMERRYAYDAAAVNSDSYDRDDSEILSDFMKRLAQLGPIDTHEVTVSSESQTITLSGTVLNQDIKRFLGLVADNVLGVRSVKNQLTIPRFGATQVQQKDTAKSIEDEAFARLDEIIPSTDATTRFGNPANNPSTPNNPSSEQTHHSAGEDNDPTNTD